MAVLGLSGIRVVEAAGEIAGPYAGKLFVDAGAEVVKLEPAGGDPMRKWSATGADLTGRDAALFCHLNGGKQSVVADVWADAHAAAPGGEVDRLLAGAHLLVEDGWADVAELRRRHRHLVIVSVTPFGRVDGWADRPWSELVVQAESGGLLCRGRPDQPPIQAGGRINEWTTGSYVGPVGLAAVLRARRTGVGDHVDVSMAEVCAIAMSTFSDVANQLAGGQALGPSRSVETPSIEPALDGWVGFNTNTGQMFENFLIMIERFDLLETKEWHNLRDRSARLDEWNEVIAAWTTRHTVAEIVERASELRIPVAPVLDGPGVTRNDHFVERRVLVEHPDGFEAPRPPYLVDGEPPPAPRPAPAVGSATGVLAWEPVAPSDAAAEPSELPFAGLKVLDLTSWWAGPSSTHVFALLGADVVHVESTGHPDGMRLTGAMFGAADWWEWGHMFVAANTNKRGITLDLASETGRDLVWRLIDSSDLIVENFAPRVMDKYGITWDEIRRRNPSAVFVRMPAFGLTGPWRERVGFAQTMEQLTGMAWLTGHTWDQPRILRGPCDPIAGMHGAFSAMVALARRERTGEGGFVEATMVEAALNCSAEQIIDHTAYGHGRERDGNRAPEAAPQGVYAGPGEDRWVALSVVTDDQWLGLTRAVGRTEWATDAELATMAGRRARHDELDEVIAAWAAERPVEAAAEALRSHGVPAAVAQDPRTLRRHQLFAGRGFFEPTTHVDAGPIEVPGAPYKLSTIEGWIRSPAPTLGQHNREVLAERLGLGDDELDELERQGVIGTRPAGL